MSLTTINKISIIIIIIILMKINKIIKIFLMIKNIPITKKKLRTILLTIIFKFKKSKISKLK